MTRLILTAIGPDRPGLTEALASAVQQAGGNWLESQLARLGGQFAGAVLVDMAAGQVDVLRAAVGTATIGLTVAVVEAGSGADAGTPLTLQLVGADRPGIVREVAAALAALQVNIDALDSEIEHSAWSGDLLFRARLQLALPAGITPAMVQDALEDISGEIMVDLTMPLARR